jgi:DNA-binding beta-propeller fold protein YncE
MVRLSPDATRAYVTAREGKGTLSVVSLAGDSEPVVIETGKGAEGITVTPDGSEVWVLDRDLGRISIVDTTTLRVVERLDARPSPNRVAISDNGRAIVTNGTSGEKIVQYLNVYDVESRARLKEAPLRGGTPHAGAFGILTVGDDLFISDTNGGRVLAFDLGNLDALDAPRVLASGLEKERPDGMVWTAVRVVEDASAGIAGSEAEQLGELDREAAVR